MRSIKYFFLPVILLVSLAHPVGAEESGGLSLIGQTPWVNEEHLTFDIRVSGPLERGFFVIQAHQGITQISSLSVDQVGAGDLLGSPVLVPLSSSLNSSGVATFDLSVSALPENEADLTLGSGAVYPFTVQLTSIDGTVLDQFVTPVIVPDDSFSSPLTTALRLSVAGPPPLQSDGSVVFDDTLLTELRALGDAVSSHPSVPVTILLPPATVVGLSRSGLEAHGQLVDLLTPGLESSVKIASASFVTADPEAWRQVNRSDIYRDLLTHGDVVFVDRLGVVAQRSVTLLEPTATAETLSLLLQFGSTEFLVDAHHLTPIPGASSDAFIQPVALRDANGQLRSARVLDPQISSYFTNYDEPVVAVQFLLAHLALLSWSVQEDASAVVVVPEQVALLPLLVDLLFNTLSEAPFVELSHLEPLVLSEDFFGPTFDLWPTEVASMVDRANGHGLVEMVLSAYQELLGGPHPSVITLTDLLETTTAVELSNDEVNKYFSAIYHEVTEMMGQFYLPDSQNVRLTSRQATVPFTVENNLSVPATVVIDLTSDGRLTFPDGEEILVTLQPGSNRILLTVAARASGDARVQVTLRSPDQSRLLQLASTQLFVRTTKLSGVGVLLLVMALSVLAVWWVRSARTARPVSPGYHEVNPQED